MSYPEGFAVDEALQYLDDVYPDAEPPEPRSLLTCALVLRSEVVALHELFDGVASVYSHVTEGRISKPNTAPGEVKSEHDEFVTRLVEEEVAEQVAELADEIEREAKSITEGATIRGGLLDGASLYNVRMYAARLVRDMFARAKA